MGSMYSKADAPSALAWGQRVRGVGRDGQAEWPSVPAAGGGGGTSEGVHRHRYGDEGGGDDAVCDGDEWTVHRLHVSAVQSVADCCVGTSVVVDDTSHVTPR